MTGLQVGQLTRHSVLRLNRRTALPPRRRDAALPALSSPAPALLLRQMEDRPPPSSTPTSSATGAGAGAGRGAAAAGSVRRDGVVSVDVIDPGDAWISPDAANVTVVGAALLLHGYTSHSERWAPELLKQLNEIGLRVVLPTYGEDFPSIRKVAKEALDAAHAAAPYAGSPLVIIGHSMGGMLAQEAVSEALHRRDAWLGKGHPDGASPPRREQQESPAMDPPMPLAAAVLAGTGAPAALALRREPHLTEVAIEGPHKALLSVAEKLEDMVLKLRDANRYANAAHRDAAATHHVPPLFADARSIAFATDRLKAALLEVQGVGEVCRKMLQKMRVDAARTGVDPGAVNEHSRGVAVNKAPPSGENPSLAELICAITSPGVSGRDDADKIVFSSRDAGVDDRIRNMNEIVAVSRWMRGVDGARLIADAPVPGSDPPPLFLVLGAVGDVLFPPAHADLLVRLAPRGAHTLRIQSDDPRSTHALRELLDEREGVQAMARALDSRLEHYRRRGVGMRDRCHSAGARACGAVLAADDGGTTWEERYVSGLPTCAVGAR